MKPRDTAHALRRVEARLWTGWLGHLLGGALDVAQGLLLYMRTRKADGGRSLR